MCWGISFWRTFIRANCFYFITKLKVYKTKSVKLIVESVREKWKLLKVYESVQRKCSLHWQIRVTYNIRLLLKQNKKSLTSIIVWPRKSSDSRVSFCLSFDFKSLSSSQTRTLILSEELWHSLKRKRTKDIIQICRNGKLVQLGGEKSSCPLAFKRNSFYDSKSNWLS